MDSKYTNVDEYIALYSGDIYERLMSLRTLAKDMLPGSTECISYGMPTYKYPKNLVHFAAQKHHIGFYPGADAIEHFGNSGKLDSYKFSKGAIQFPNNEPLPLDLVREIIQYRIECTKDERK